MPQLKSLGWVAVGLLFIQIIFGGLMAGMRAGLVHPYFPFFIEWSRLAQALLTTVNIGAEQLVDYEASISIKAWVQVIHRTMAYLLVGFIVYLVHKTLKQSISQRLRRTSYLLISMLITQFLLGILTIINCFGKVPIAYGAMHQAGALLLLVLLLFYNYQFESKQ